MSGQEGRLGPETLSMQESLASIADWARVVTLDMSLEGGAVDLTTRYPGYVCKKISNWSGVDGNVTFTTTFGDTNTATNIVNGGATDKLPRIGSVAKTGTVDGKIGIYLQKINDA